MAEITNITKNGKDRYGIYLDGSFFCHLKSETIVKNCLQVGTNLSEDKLEELQLQNEKLIAFDKAVNFLSGIKSEKQVKDYLYQKGYRAKTVNYVLGKLKEYNYINDEVFAKFYIQNYNKKKGLRLLKFELSTKGVKDEIIEKVLENFDDNDETILQLAEKYLKNKERDKKTAVKLTNHLFSKGFTFDKINKVVKKLFYEIDLEDN